MENINVNAETKDVTAAFSEGETAIAIIGGADGPTSVFVAQAATSETAEETTVVTTTVAETESPLGNVTVEPKNFVENLGYMGTGMAGIFVVIAIIIGATVLMNKIFSDKK